MTAMKAFTRIVFIALLATSAHADDKPTEPPKTATDTTKDTAKDTTKKEKLTANELQVVAHYHELNLMEIDLGKAAMKNAPNQAVKAYAEMLVKDHSEGDVKIKALAKKLGQAIPKEKPATEAEKQEQADAKKAGAALKKLKGAEFEKEYLRMMVDGHEKELAKIDSKVAEVKNSELADMLRDKKPTLQKHADQARELQKSGAQAMK
jgi:putative membrane protein